MEGRDYYDTRKTSSNDKWLCVLDYQQLNYVHFKLTEISMLKAIRSNI